jgi:hypothetical protein
MPSIAKLMSPLNHPDEVELRLQFQSVEEAEAHVFQEFEVPPVDHTLPTNHNQVLAIVKALKDAFHSDCYALDGHSSLKWWRENRDDTRLEVAAWKVYVSRPPFTYLCMGLTCHRNCSSNAIPVARFGHLGTTSKRDEQRASSRTA